MNERIYKILAVSFLLIIFSIGIMFIISEKKEKNEVENRQLAVMPEFRIAKLDPFPSQFDEYFTDHFPYRNEIIKEYSKFTGRVFNKSPLPKKVVIGNDGWLYMARRCMEGFQGKTNFTEAQLKSIKEELEYRREYCAQRGIKYYFVILPHKTTIYPEYIPIRFKIGNEYTPRTQLTKYLSENNVPFIDVVQDVLSNKEIGYLLFKKTDNHWNELGAFFGTKRVMKELRKDFPQIPNIRIEDYNITTKKLKGGNIAQMLNMKEEYEDINVILERKTVSLATKGNKTGYAVPNGFPYGWDYEVVRVNPKVNHLKLLIIRESFGGAMIKFYQEGFGRSVSIFDAWKHKLNEDIIKEEKPDIVIQQVVESFLPNLLKNQSRPL